MPRRFDGVPPERPAGNELPGRIADILERVLHQGDGFGDRPVFRDLIGDHFPRFGDGPVAFDGGPVRDHSQLGGVGGAPGVQNWHDLNPDAGSDKAAVGGDAGGAALHFDPEVEFHRHVDHYNSQALSVHPDWFML